MKQEGFTPIGRTARAVTLANPIVDGSNVGPGGAVVSRPDTSAVSAWLAKQAPADMDKAAVSRASQHGVGLRVKYEGRFPIGPNGERLPSYMVAVSCDVSDGGDRKAALADLRNFLVPAPQREIEGWLAELSVIVAKRRDDAFDEGLRLEAYAGRLRAYPADVARAAVLKRPSWQFWPTWAEMEKVCDMLASPRYRMIHALENPPEPEPVRRPPTPEEINRVQALIDELFPHQPSAMRSAAVAEMMKGDCMTGAPQ